MKTLTPQEVGNMEFLINHPSTYQSIYAAMLKLDINESLLVIPEDTGGRSPLKVLTSISSHLAAYRKSKPNRSKAYSFSSQLKDKKFSMRRLADNTGFVITRMG